MKEDQRTKAQLIEDLQDMTATLKDAARQANVIASGDYTAEIAPPMNANDDMSVNSGEVKARRGEGILRASAIVHEDRERRPTT